MALFSIDLGRLDIESKAIGILLLLIIPFHFLAAYLFRHSLIIRVPGYPFVVDLDFWFIAFLCFCLSLLWIIFNFLINSIQEVGILNNPALNSISSIVSSILFNAVMFLSMGIIINYMILKKGFFGFIAISYGCGIIFILIQVIEKRIRNWRKNRKIL